MWPSRHSLLKGFSALFRNLRNSSRTVFSLGNESSYDLRSEKIVSMGGDVSVIGM